LVSKQTALEQQLMGSVAELDRQALLLTPMRGEPTSTGEAARPDPYRAAVAGRAFRLDEIDHWLKQGYLAEQGNATVKVVKPFPASPANIAARFHRLVAEENRDRTVIIDHLIRNSNDLSGADHAKLAHIFYQLRMKEIARDHP